VAGKIMSLWISSSISEVSWEGTAQGSGDLIQPGKGCSGIAWELGSAGVGAWVRKPGSLGGVLVSSWLCCGAGVL